MGWVETEGDDCAYIDQIQNLICFTDFANSIIINHNFKVFKVCTRAHGLTLAGLSLRHAGEADNSPSNLLVGLSDTLMSDLMGGTP